MYDVIVVGASVSGNRAAELLSSQDYDVLVIEEHRETGKPVKCTGLVSWRLLELLSDLPKEIIVNTVDSAKFFSPSGNSFTLKSKNTVYVIDRCMLDNYLNKKAKEAGAKVKLSTKFENFKHAKEGIEVTTNKGKFKTKILIGADGASSQVAKSAGIKLPSNILVGMQTTVNKNFDPNSVELWFGSSIAPNFFAWVVPENKNTARVGLATNHNVRELYENFLRKRIGFVTKPNVGGLIRIGLPNTTVANRVLLVGDAACQIKPFSGGGITYGLIASKFCADACVSAIENNNFDKSFLENHYDREWRKKLEKPIKKGLLYRKIFDKLSDRQLDFLFSSGKITGLTKFLEYFDMDLL